MAIDWTKLIYANTSTPYLDSYEKLSNSYNAQAKKDIANIEGKRDADLAKSNAGYDNTARQNYINYMQAQKRLPSQLNAMGIRGGASESSLVRLGTNYGTNVASNESARQGAADSIRQAYAQQVADYNKDLNERLAQAKATAEQNQISWEREQVDKDLQRFSGVIEGLYKKRSSYEKLIEQLKKSKDPNKKYKIMLARRAMNQLSENNGGGGGGYKPSGGGYKPSGGGNYNGGDNNYNNNNKNINDANERGKSQTEYYKRMMNNANKNKGKTKKTSNVWGNNWSR